MKAECELSLDNMYAKLLFGIGVIMFPHLHNTNIH